MLEKLTAILAEIRRWGVAILAGLLAAAVLTAWLESTGKLARERELAQARAENAAVAAKYAGQMAEVQAQLAARQTDLNELAARRAALERTAGVLRARLTVAVPVGGTPLPPRQSVERNPAPPELIAPVSPPRERADDAIGTAGCQGRLALTEQLEANCEERVRTLDLTVGNQWAMLDSYATAVRVQKQELVEGRKLADVEVKAARGSWWQRASGKLKCMVAGLGLGLIVGLAASR